MIMKYYLLLPIRSYASIILAMVKTKPQIVLGCFNVNLITSPIQNAVDKFGKCQNKFCFMDPAGSYKM